MTYEIIGQQYSRLRTVCGEPNMCGKRLTVRDGLCQHLTQTGNSGYFGSLNRVLHCCCCTWHRDRVFCASAVQHGVDGMYVR